MVKHALIALLFATTPIAGAAPQATPQKRTPVQQTAPPATKRFTRLTTNNVMATVGETRTLEATLTFGTAGGAAAGKPVTFKVKKDDGTQLLVLPTVVTNAQGKATLPWKIPEYAQAVYTVTASFGGDSESMASSDDARCHVLKANTEFDARYHYGALDSHGGPKFGTVSITLRRKSDLEAIAKPIRVTVDGQPRELTSRSTPLVITLPEKKDVYVKMEFAGDGSNHGTMYHDRYQLD